MEAGILVYEFARIAWGLECDEWVVDGRVVLVESRDDGVAL